MFQKESFKWNDFISCFFGFPELIIRNSKLLCSPKMYFWPLGDYMGFAFITHLKYSKEPRTKWGHEHRVTKPFSLFQFIFCLNWLDVPLMVHKAWQICWVLFKLPNITILESHIDFCRVNGTLGKISTRSFSVFGRALRSACLIIKCNAIIDGWSQLCVPPVCFTVYRFGVFWHSWLPNQF